MKRKMIVNNWQSWLKIGLVAVSAVVFALFWLVGYDMPYEEDADFNAPLLTDALLGYVYLLTAVAVGVAVFSAIHGFWTRSRQGSVENGVPTARISKVTDLKKAKAFLEEIGGYPIIAKPECGVGAAHTYKITKDAELEEFFATRPDVAYVMEEFIEGDIVSYDVITDNRCEPLFESMTCWPPSIADIVNNKLDLDYYTAATVPEALRTLGRATVKAFDVKSRFVHLEFFCLRKNKNGLGKKGDFVGLEVNMRPAGGYTPDMMNWAHATDVYQIWADMVAFNERRVPDLNMDHCCVYASRRDCYQYKHSWDEVMEKYRDKIVMAERLPALWYDAMGNYMFTAHIQRVSDSTCPTRPSAKGAAGCALPLLPRTEGTGTSRTSAWLRRSCPGLKAGKSISCWLTAWTRSPGQARTFPAPSGLKTRNAGTTTSLTSSIPPRKDSAATGRRRSQSDAQWAATMRAISFSAVPISSRPWFPFPEPSTQIFSSAPTWTASFTTTVLRLF